MARYLPQLALTLVCLTLICLTLSGCGRADQGAFDREVAQREAYEKDADAASGKMASLGYISFPDGGQGAGASAEPGADGEVLPASTHGLRWNDRMLIRRADMVVEVDDIDAGVWEVENLVDRHGALISDTQVRRGEDETREAWLNVQVAPEGFQELLAEFRTLGVVHVEQVKTDDVTKAYADLGTRLEAKERTADRLRELLSNRTGELADVLKVERELERLIVEMERMKGERRYYESKVAVSTISVKLRETVEEPLVAAAPGPIVEAVRDAVKTLEHSTALLVYLIVAVAPWMALAALGWWSVRLMRTRAGRAS
ncbi:hypothetical protein ABI59_12270 [Acidobacteria bacterium Mor1]|nr:hypothetical protein ABI59_12270 [Acidobacteria bacterium Mor1]